MLFRVTSDKIPPARATTLSHAREPPLTASADVGLLWLAKE